MANNIIRRTWKQGGMVNIEDLRGSAFQAEDGGHTFLISGVDENGDALALSGTPAGVLLRADGQDVTLTCSVSDGVVSATLPANAYVVPGRIGITIFLTNGGQKTAIYAAIAAVATTSSGTVAPPAGSDVVDLVNAIATAVATIPASYTDLMAAVAPTYSTSALYAVGSYAWYSGKLYRCTTAITSGETWTSAHWTQANLGSDVSDLKSATDINPKIIAVLQTEDEIDITDVPLTVGGSYNNKHKWTANATMAATKFDIRVPNGSKIIASCTEGAVYIQSFNASTGNRVNNISGTPNSPAVLSNANGELIYSLAISRETMPASLSNYTFKIQSNPNNAMNQLKKEVENVKYNVNVVGNIITTGASGLDVELELGYYNSSGSWVSAQTNATTKTFYQFADDMSLTLTTTLENVFAYIQEYSLSGSTYTRTANIGGTSSVVFPKTRADRYYIFTLANSIGFEEVPTTGWTIEIRSSYFDAKGTSNSGLISYSYTAPTGNTYGILELTCDKTYYVIQRRKDTGTNLDTWRLYKGAIKINDQFVLMWNGTDAEGPILIEENEEHFVSGFHGYEELTDAKIYIDDTVLDLAQSSSGICTSVMLYQTSKVYEFGTETQAFTRHKRVRIVGNDFNVQQRWIATEACTVYRGAFCLMQCPKSIMMDDACWDTDRLLPMGQRSGVGTVQLDKKTRIGNLYLQDGKVISLVAEVGADNEYFAPCITDYNSNGRFKYYFDMYNGKELSIGDEIVSKFSFKVNELQ